MSVRQQLPTRLQTLIGKRRALFLEHLDSKRKHLRIDVYMSFLKHFAGKHIYDLDDPDVLDFLIFKDTNDSGRTIIHHTACPNIGLTSLEDCTDKTRCSFSRKLIL